MKPKNIKYIGVDVGGTKILAQAFDDRVRLITEKREPTDSVHGRAGFLKQLYRLIDGFFSSSVRGIGIALPGIVDTKKGVLVRAPHLVAGDNMKVKDLLRKRYGVRVHVDHDINGFMVAEYRSPRLKKLKNVLAVMVGTGLGGAAIVDGKLDYGAKGYAGEFGHMVIDQSGELQTFEKKTSGHHLPLIAKEIGIPRAERWTGAHLAERLRAKDGSAQELQKAVTESLGIGLSNLNLIFNPEAIVLGGSVYLKCLASQKAELKKIIARHSLAGKSPAIIDADPDTSVARGVVLLLTQKKP